MRVVGHGRGVATHDAGQRLDLRIISDHAHLAIDRDSVAIEQLERLARLPPAHVQAAMNLVEVKNMRGTTQLEHHVVGNVHQRGHAALAATGQPVHHPLRRGGAGVDLPDHTA